MSELINNREYRQKVLKELILELHEGKSAEDVKERFHSLIKDISAVEISEMEGALISEGMAVEEVQRLCDVHASVFKGTIDEIHHPEQSPGHPIHTFRRENRAIEEYINSQMLPDLEVLKKQDTKENRLKLESGFNILFDVDKHYSRKENLLFPYLEKNGITAPPKVMWGVDDEIRAGLKECKKLLRDPDSLLSDIIDKIEESLNKIKEMIFKEENILFPMSLENLSEDEWYVIYQDSDEIGYCITEPEGIWRPVKDKMVENQMDKTPDELAKGIIKFDTGVLKFEELNGVLNTLPFDITFVDKDGIVKYFTNGTERIFPRAKAVIGRSVENCHPPASVHVVEKVVENLRSGKKDHEDFWIKMGPNYVFIRYFAVRDEKGEFLGTLEITQNIQPIQEITGEKRLLDS